MLCSYSACICAFSTSILKHGQSPFGYYVLSIKLQPLPPHLKSFGGGGQGLGTRHLERGERVLSSSSVKGKVSA